MNHTARSVLPLLAAVSLFATAGCATHKASDRPRTAYAQPQSHFARFGTNKVHYLTAGRGNHVLVFVHCWAGNAGFWSGQLPALAAKARLVLVDLPGHGQSDKPDTAYTMDFFASAVLAVMNVAHVRKATLIGHSMGAPVICRVYAQAPERVAALVSVDGLLHRPPMTQEQADQFKAPFSAPGYRAHTTNFINAMFPVPGTEATRDRVLKEILETPQYVMAGSMDGMFNLNYSDWDLKHVDVPVIAINTDNPMWTDAGKDYIRSLSARSDYRTIEGTGHWLMLEKPDEFNTTLTEELEKFGLVN